MKNKIGNTIVLNELIYLIVSVLAIVAFVSKGLPYLKEVIIDSPDKYSVNNFKRLVKEISSFIDDYQYKKNNGVTDFKDFTRNIPININDKLGLIFYNMDDEKPRSCKKDAACVCLMYNKDYSAGIKKVYSCESFKKGYDFDVDFASYSGTDPDDANKFISTEGIGSYKLYINNVNVIGIVPEVKWNVEFNKFDIDFPDIVDHEESLYKDGSSDYVRPFGTNIDTIVVHFSGTDCASENACPVSTVGVLKDRIAKGTKVSAHYAIERDGTIIQMIPNSARAYHAGCLADHSPSDVTRDAWESGRLLCNDFSSQNEKYSRDYFQSENDHSIGIEMTAKSFESSEGCPSGWLETKGLDYYTGNILIYKPSDKIYCWQSYTDEEYKALAKLIVKLVLKYNIPVDYDHIIGHDRVTYDKIDPGANFDWKKLMCMVENSINTESVKLGSCDKFDVVKKDCSSDSCVVYEKKNLLEA